MFVIENERRLASSVPKIGPFFSCCKVSNVFGDKRNGLNAWRVWELHSLCAGASFQGSSSQCVFITALFARELSLFPETAHKHSGGGRGGACAIMFG